VCEADAFDLLSSGVKSFIHSEGWSELRSFQNEAIHQILCGDQDLLISAPTSSGKTETALLPVFSIAERLLTPGLKVIYIVPLKALANDLLKRLTDLGDRTVTPIHLWHGDVADHKKKAFLAEPSGLLVLTPESSESLFVNQREELPRILAGLQVVIVDEVHSFHGTERGAQLQSLLNRIERVVGRSIRRIALSATVGDPSATAEFLRPARGQNVALIMGRFERRVQVQLSVHLIDSDAQSLATAMDGIADLIVTKAGRNSLVFVNSRAAAEEWTPVITRAAGNQRDVATHHGSLSAIERHRGERLLRNNDRPVTVVATSTLEQGIDLGAVDRIAQVGSPPSVAALHQRAGRGGRRTTDAFADIMLIERVLATTSTPVARIRPQLVQAIATVELMSDGWCESPVDGLLHLSTVVQQVVSMTAYHGAVTLNELAEVLLFGSFPAVSKGMLATVVTSLKQHRVLREDPDRPHFLRLDNEGERLVSNYHFLAAFSTPVEFRLFGGGRQIGKVPFTRDLEVGYELQFAGRTWEIVSIDWVRRRIELEISSQGSPPTFPGSAPAVDFAVRQRMHRIYSGSDTPDYLAGDASRALDEARANFRALGLTHSSVVREKRESWIFPWLGDRGLAALQLLLARQGIRSKLKGVALNVGASPDSLFRALEYCSSYPPTVDDIVHLAPTRPFEKHHRYLPERLVQLEYVKQCCDLNQGNSFVAELMNTDRCEPLISSGGHHD
jgi:ATP-dependent Lhr-like helicase